MFLRAYWVPQLLPRPSQPRLPARIFRPNSQKWLCTSPESKELMEANLVYLKDEWKGNDIFLLGTMHVSEESAKEVQRLIRDVKPDVVMIELDAQRALKLRQQYGKVSNDDFARAVVPLNQLPMPMGFSMLEEMFKKFYEYFRILGIIPGKEFLVAMEEAEKIGADIVLGDRNVTVTLSRLVNSFTLPSLMNLFSGMSNGKGGMFDMFGRNRSGPKIDPSDPTSILTFLESIRNRRDVRELTKKTRKVCPDMARVMIDERDVYMINSIRRINVQNKKIVAVVGLGHIDGMEDYWMTHLAQAKKLGLSENDLNKP